MDMRRIAWLIILILVGLAVAFLFFAKSDKGGLQQPATNTDQGAGVPLDMDLIILDSPAENSVIKSPLAVTGKARGFWFFEASFPVRVFDANNKELGVGIAQAQGNWMTIEMVPFVAKVEFRPSPTDMGFLVLEKDNPSGLLEHAQEMRYPIRFR